MNRLHSFIKEYHPIVHTLILGTVLARAAGSMSLPFLAIYLSHNFTMTPVTIGLIIGTGSIASTVGGFIGGTLSDRLGRKRIMMQALYAWALVYVGFGLAKEPWMFIVLSTLNGMCRSFFEPVSQALMADVTVPEKRHRVFSLRYMAINIGVAVGPLVGAYLGLAAGAVPFIVTGVIYLLYALSLELLMRRFGIKQIEGQKKERVTFAAAWNVVRQDVSLRYYLMGSILTSFGYSQMTVTLSQYVEKSIVDGISLFAWLMSINAITVVVLQIPIAKWAEKRTPFVSIVVGVCLYALGDLGFAFSGGWTAFIISMIIFTLGEILTYPAGDIYIDRIAKEGMRGSYYGSKTFSNLGQFAGPWIGGLLLASYNGSTMFVTVAAVTMFSIWFYWNGQRVYETAAAKAVHGTVRLGDN